MDEVSLDSHQALIFRNSLAVVDSPKFLAELKRGQRKFFELTRFTQLPRDKFAQLSRYGAGRQMRLFRRLQK